MNQISEKGSGLVHRNLKGNNSGRSKSLKLYKSSVSPRWIGKCFEPSQYGWFFQICTVWQHLAQFGCIWVNLVPVRVVEASVGGEEQVILGGARQRRGCQGRALHHQDATLYHIVIFIWSILLLKRQMYRPTTRFYIYTVFLQNIWKRNWFIRRTWIWKYPNWTHFANNENST